MRLTLGGGGGGVGCGKVELINETSSSEGQLFSVSSSVRSESEVKSQTQPGFNSTGSLSLELDESFRNEIVRLMAAESVDSKSWTLEGLDGLGVGV